MCFMQAILHAWWHTRTMRMVYLQADPEEAHPPSNYAATIKALRKFFEDASNLTPNSDEVVNGRGVYDGLITDGIIREGFEDAPMVYMRVMSETLSWLLDKGFDDVRPYFEASLQFRYFFGKEANWGSYW